MPKMLKDTLVSMQSKVQDEFLNMTLQVTSLQDLSDSKSAAYLTFEHRMSQVILALVKLGFLEPTIQTYQDCLFQSIKESIKQVTDSCLSNLEVTPQPSNTKSAQDENVPLGGIVSAAQMVIIRSLNHDQFVTLV